MRSVDEKVRRSAHLQMRDIEKTYPGVHALKGVSVDFAPGCITAVVGENGAGKSTLMKVIAGAELADSGHVLLDGVELAADPLGAIQSGVNVIYQELTDVPEMTVMENVLLARLPSRSGWLHKAEARRQARAALRQVGLERMSLDRKVGELSLAHRQLIEIARSLARNTSVLVLDEPTSSLHEREKETLVEVLKRLRTSGMSILYVSHHLAEVFELADHIVVMRDGTVVAQRPAAEWTEETLVRSMLAKDLAHTYPWRHRDLGQTVLRVAGLSAPGIDNVNLDIREREIVGIVGLAGAGRTETMRAIAGAVRSSGGEVSVAGEVVTSGSVPAAQGQGIFFVPEDRKSEGVILDASIIDNVTHGIYPMVSSRGFIQRRRQRSTVGQAVAAFGVKTSSVQQTISQLSGGNQQKVILARAALRNPRVLLLDDPTRGVDVGAKSSVYEHAITMAEEGAAILLASSETDEVLAMADRVYVFRSGRIVGQIERSDFDRERILQLAAAG